MNAVSVAVESAGATLMKALLNQVERLQKPWNQVPEREQEQVIFHLRQAVEVAVRGVVKRIAAGNFTQIPVDVESVTFKDGVKAVVQLAKEDAHALADRTGGGHAMIVLANEQEFFDGIEKVQADADQAELDLETDEEPEPAIVVPCESFLELVANAIEEPAVVEGVEPPAPKTMGQIVQELLAKVHVHVQAVVTETWSEAEAKVAAYWAIEFAKNYETAPARPHWLPHPVAIPEGYTRVFHSPIALSAYVDVPPAILTQVCEAWGEKEGKPGYDDFVSAINAAEQVSAPTEPTAESSEPTQGEEA